MHTNVHTFPIGEGLRPLPYLPLSGPCDYLYALDTGVIGVAPI